MGAVAAIPSVLGDLLGGGAQQTAYNEQALELRQQAQIVKTQAEEQSSSRLDALNRTVGAITAITSSRGLNVDSASALAVAGQRKKTAMTDVGTINANAAVQAGMLSESAKAAIMAGQNAQMNSWFKSVGDVVGNVNSTASQAMGFG